MKYERKGLSMPMEIIIAVVVLVVIALAVIMFTTGGITRTGGSTSATQATAASGAECQAQAQTYCTNNPSQLACHGIGSSTVDCNKCTGSVPCGRTCAAYAGSTCPSGTIPCGGNKGLVESAAAPCTDGTPSGHVCCV